MLRPTATAAHSFSGAELGIPLRNERKAGILFLCTLAALLTVAKQSSSLRLPGRSFGWLLQVLVAVPVPVVAAPSKFSTNFHTTQSRSVVLDVVVAAAVGG